MKPVFPFSRRERRALALIVFLIMVMRVALAFREEVQIYTRPFNEDAFYLFSSAEHLAKGHGLTVDGTHLTNGVQPLIVLLYAPTFYFTDFDKLTALRIFFAYQALIDALTALLLAFLVRSVVRASGYEYSDSAWRSPTVMAAALWGLLYPIYVHTTNGLETGLAALFIIWSLLLYSEICRIRRAGEKPRVSRWVWLGIVLGLTVLSRIDTVILIASIGIVEILRYRSRGIGHAIVISVTAALISSPWWIYNYFVFHNIMPQSGLAESLIIDPVRNGWMAATVIADAMSVFFFLPKAVEVSNVITVLWIILVVAGLWFVHRKTGLFYALQTRIHFFPLMPLILMCIGLAVFYIAYFGAPHFIPRYFQPFRILAVILAAVALPHIRERIRNSRPAKRIYALCLIIAFLFSFVRYGYAFVFETGNDFYYTGKWALSVSNERIGMNQSGTTGFIAPNVTNLDGKVNLEALNARMYHDIGGYIAKERFDYLADWKAFVTELARSAQRYGVAYEPFDTIGSIHIYKRTP